jgi:hypothetical protein
MRDPAGSARDRFEDVMGTPSDIRDHLPRLRREARGSVLELGVRDGNSTVALLAGLEELGGTLWSVDVTAECGDVFPGHPQWRFVVADSRDTSTVLAAGLPAELDVLFVDTIHTYEQVRRELDAWGDRVRLGGSILFHDTDSFPEIRRAISEWCRPRHVPFEFLRRSNGLGVAYPGRGRGYGAWLGLVRAVRQLRWAGALRVGQAAHLAARVARRLRREVSRRR